MLSFLYFSSELFLHISYASYHTTSCSVIFVSHFPYSSLHQTGCSAANNLPFIILIMKSTFCKGTTYTLFLEWRMYQRQGDKPGRKETKKTDQQNHRCLNLGFTGRMDKRRWVWQMLRWLSTKPGARTQEEKQERRTIPRFLNLCGRRA